MARKRYLIVGDGAAGLSAAQTLRRLDRSATIALLSEDPNPAYFRAALTNFLLGELREDQIWAVPPDFFQVYEVHRLLTRVVGVDPTKRLLWETASTAPVAYDELVIASGARPRPADFEGGRLNGVLTLRTVQDVRRVVDWLKLGGLRSAVVVGGGPLGLEWAHGLREHGVAVRIVERASRLMPRVLDQVASDLLAARLRHAGIEVWMGEEIAGAWAAPHGSVGGLSLRSGASLPCELIAVATGVVPNTEFLQNTGIALTAAGAVRVDRHMKSSAAGVWAAGDVAEVEGERLQLWEPAQLQGRVAARNIAGKPARYDPGAHYFATRLFDLDFACVGSIAADASTEEIVDFPRGTGSIAYRKLVLRDGKLAGALLLGERSARVRRTGRAYKRLVDAQIDVRPIRDRLLDRGFDFEGWLDTNRLLAPPPALSAAPVASAARLRGTQLTRAPVGAKAAGTAALPQGDLGAAALQAARRATAAISLSAPSGGTAIVPAATTAARSTRMLSIGLLAEAPATQLVTGKPLDAHLEGAFGRYEISRAVTSIGRSRDADIVLDDPHVASLHAQIQRYGDALFLRDLGSSTGTWVDGVAIYLPWRLGDGERIRVGGSELVFRSRVLAHVDQLFPTTLAAALRPGGRLHVQAGPEAGRSVPVGDRMLIGSQHNTCGLVFPALAPIALEIAVGERGFWARDVSGQNSIFRSGAPLGAAPVELSDGDLLLIGGGIMLRFEERR
jgi:nitrite reductase (NADH) large subunit